LGRRGEREKASELLLSLMHDKKADYARRYAGDSLKALGESSEQVLNKLAALAQDRRMEVWIRRDAADALGCIGKRETAVELLLRLAQDNGIRGWTRSDAALSLGELAERDKAVDLLISLAHDSRVDE
jgi:HEAT repeat protein